MAQYNLSPISSDPCHTPYSERTGFPGTPRPSWRRVCCRDEVDPCKPRPHRHSHAPWIRYRTLAPAAAPACRIPCPAARATRASALPGSPEFGAALRQPSLLSSTSCCSHRTEICIGGTGAKDLGLSGLALPRFSSHPSTPQSCTSNKVAPKLMMLVAASLSTSPKVAFWAGGLLDSRGSWDLSSLNLWTRYS